MIRQDFEINLADGSAECVLLLPDGGGPWPGIIHLTDVGGIRAAQVAIAEQLVGEGYAVWMPNLFYRTSRTPVFTIGFDAPRDAFMARAKELIGPLTPESLEGDAHRIIEEFLKRPELRKHRLGVVGYCFSGRVALRHAAARPDVVAAAASFHGGGLFTDTPASPHLLLSRIKARLYFGHAVNDSSMTSVQIAGLEAALSGWGGLYESEIYEGAYHGWTTADSPVYNAAQARRAFFKVRSLFAETVQGHMSPTHE